MRLVFTLILTVHVVGSVFSALSLTCQHIIRHRSTIHYRYSWVGNIVMIGVPYLAGRYVAIK